MPPRGYVYEVMRIKIKEFLLLSEYDKAYLMSCCSTRECIEFLVETKGWGYSLKYLDYNAVLRDELNKTWSFILDLTRDPELFQVFLCQNDYQNLKISIRSVVANSDKEPLFAPGGMLQENFIYENVKKKDFKDFPDYMKADAEKAMNVLLETGDAMAFDIMLDKSLFAAMNVFAKSSGCELVDYYVKTIIACSNIKTVLGCIEIKKDAEFIKNACFPCEDLSTDKLVSSALKGKSQFYDYLKFTDYSLAVKPLSDSLVSFEVWRDDMICQRAKSEKLDLFSKNPLVAYVLARINEISVARMIVSSKVSNVQSDLLKRRIRKLYA